MPDPAPIPQPSAPVAPPAPPAVLTDDDIAQHDASLNGADYLKILPAQKAGTVKALSEGRMQFPAARALSSPYWQDMLSSVAQYDPSFDATNYGNRAATRKAFTASGGSTPAAQLNALTTLAGHLGELSDKADALGNSGFTPYNTLKNWVEQKFDDPSVNNFNTVLHKVADEDVRAYRGSGGSEQDIKQRLSDFNTSNGPKELHGAIGETAKLVQSKIEALEKQYQDGMGPMTPAVPLLQMTTPQARATLQKLITKASGATDTPAPGLQPGQKVRLKDGKTGVIKTVHPDGSFDIQ